MAKNETATFFYPGPSPPCINMWQDPFTFFFYIPLLFLFTIRNGTRRDSFHLLPAAVGVADERRC